MKEFFEKLNMIALEDIERASIMLEGVNLLCNTKFAFKGNRVIYNKRNETFDALTNAKA